jgi:hypothetical protein
MNETTETTTLSATAQKRVPEHGIDNPLMRTRNKPAISKKNLNKYRFKGDVSRMIYWGSINLIVMNIVICVFFLTHQFMVNGARPFASANRVIFTMGVSLSAFCLVLWMGHVTAINRVENLVAKAIWAALIVSLLTETAMVYQMSMTAVLHDNKRIIIETIERIDESQITKLDNPQKQAILKSLADRPSDTYLACEPFQFVVKVVVSGYELDEAGKPNIATEVALINKNKHFVMRFPEVRDLEKWTMTGILQHLPADQSKALIESYRGKIVLLSIFGLEADMEAIKGVNTLRVTVRDLVSGKYNIQEIPFHIR